MFQQKFVNRVEEMKILESDWSADGASLLILYGRRRVGKTELISRFIGDRGVYFLATTEGDRENINSFKAIISKFLGDDSILKANFDDWNSFFTVLASSSSFQVKASKSKIIIAIDEFPYLIEANRAIPSVFQKLYDTILRQMKVMLILSGSSISIMENEVLSYRSPLYGRRTGQLQLKPLKFRYLSEFIDYGFEDLCKTYFVFGGIPEYLLKLDPDMGFWENVSRNMLSKGASLYEEAEFLLRTEFREPRNYMLILRSISYGNHTLGEICAYSGLDKSMVSKYLYVLMSLGLINSEKPFGASEKFKRRLYWISDQYLKFWFRYILPHKSEIESSHNEEVLESIKDNFHTFAGEQFENLMKELIVEGILGRSFDTASRWWGWNGSGKKGRDVEEIDIVAHSETRGELLFAECKWTNNPIPISVVEALKTKSETLRKRYPGKKYTYAVFSRSGFKGASPEPVGDVIFMNLSDIEYELYKKSKKPEN
ncbi:MAG: ATP-binding protein [Candidatus Thermoplasmatota archaeon]|nr:ATP-binding protein [Candidatus Thermoplasmatota archaeon]MCL5962778.1 ATP-binding protein [Candidatus Thermoplasmatota archaeon]